MLLNILIGLVVAYASGWAMERTANPRLWPRDTIGVAAVAGLVVIFLMTMFNH